MSSGLDIYCQRQETNTQSSACGRSICPREKTSGRAGMEVETKGGTAGSILRQRVEGRESDFGTAGLHSFILAGDEQCGRIIIAESGLSDDLGLAEAEAKDWEGGVAESAQVGCLYVYRLHVYAHLQVVPLTRLLLHEQNACSPNFKLKQRPPFDLIATLSQKLEPCLRVFLSSFHSTCHSPISFTFVYHPSQSITWNELGLICSTYHPLRTT